MLGIDVAAGGFVIAALTLGLHCVTSYARASHTAGLRSARLEAEIELLKSKLMASLDLVSYRLEQVEKQLQRCNQGD